MSNILKMIRTSTMDSNNVGIDLYGKEFIKDTRCAGDVAQESGARFESITLDILNFCNNGRYNITKKPNYENHWKLDFTRVQVTSILRANPLFRSTGQQGNYISYVPRTLPEAHQKMIDGRQRPDKQASVLRYYIDLINGGASSLSAEYDSLRIRGVYPNDKYNPSRQQQNKGSE